MAEGDGWGPVPFFILACNLRCGNRRAAHSVRAPPLIRKRSLFRIQLCFGDGMDFELNSETAMLAGRDRHGWVCRQIKRRPTGWLTALKVLL